MKQQTEEKTRDTELRVRKPGGLFSRLFEKLDNSMKEKAEKKAEEGCCSSKDGKKGGGCC